jgi:hypothetical protein
MDPIFRKKAETPPGGSLSPWKQKKNLPDRVLIYTGISPGAVELSFYYIRMSPTF